MEIAVEVEPSQESKQSVFQSYLEVLIFRIVCFDTFYLMRSRTGSSSTLSSDGSLSDFLYGFDHHIEMSGVGEFSGDDLSLSKIDDDTEEEDQRDESA